jgi:hypothetical protein
MKKLKLNMDSLTVESFEPAGDGTRGRGTVRARETEDTECDCGTEPVPSERGECTGEYQSCYATQCQETYWMDCSNEGFCSVVNCQSIGEC